MLQQRVPLKGVGFMPPHYPVKVLIICLNPSLVHSHHKANNNRVRTREVRLAVDNLSKLINAHHTKDNSFNTLNNISIRLKCIIYNSKCLGMYFICTRGVLINSSVYLLN